MADVSTEDLDGVGTSPAPPAGLSAAAEAAAAGARDLARSRERILGELRRVIVGQDEAIDLVLTALFTGGHCLITGVPGLAKTRLIKALADILDLPFKRIQFTPDLMPADITGTEILDESGGHRTLTFSEGPIFAQIILADEINRTPPKTQAALLEAMEEKQVTIQGRTYGLPEPFFVLATQNPIELEGTYPLPEAQLDRFMFQINIGYLPEDEELEVILRTTTTAGEPPGAVLSAEAIAGFQHLVRKVPISEPVARYAVQLARRTRPGRDDAPDYVKQYVAYGGSVRAAQYLVLGGKARALLRGEINVSFDDVRALCAPVFRHRVLTNFHAESERVSTDDLVERLLDDVKPPKSGM